jgi:Na+/H+ antiporter NhaC
METQATEITYGALALLPAILAIALAIWKRQVIVSLLFGVFVGATIINGYNPLKGLTETFSTFIVEKSLADSWNIGILTFCMAIGGMIGIIGKMGGTRAIADALIKKATGVQSTMLATALMGVAIFFDDYANSMIIGNTMRPITDKQKISREKLAYVIDSTAAPVSSMAPLSTWIAMELGLIASGLETANIEGNSMLVFFQTIPFRFYSIFAVLLVFFLIFQKKDYGAMLKAEIRARKTGAVYASDSEPLVADDPDLEPVKGISYSISDAALPILAFILITIIGLWYNGGGLEEGKSIKDAYGDADASVVLTWAAFIGSIIAGSIALLKGKLTLKTAVDSWVAGVKTMMTAVIILALAFALKAVIGEMKLAEWLINSTEGILSGQWLPLLTFVIACIIAFATGTSWGTNSILMPIVIPVAASLSTSPGEVGMLMTATIGAVLTGAVFGDHCSPISDTTILSSMAAGSDHTDHVRTQIPYAATAAFLAIVLGFIPAGLGISAWISLIVGAVLLWFIVMKFGKQIDAQGNIME